MQVKAVTANKQGALGRRQQQLEELSAASVRALADDARLNWRRQVLYRGDRALPARAPHLQVPAAQRDLNALRGIGDAHALRLRYSDQQLFASSCPEHPIERLIFEFLEQLRVETLVPDEWPGVRANVQERFLAWSRGFYHSGLAESELGIVVYTVIQMAWSRLNAMPALAETEDLIEVTRGKLGPSTGNALAGLRRHRHDQAVYAGYALELAQIISGMVQAALDEQPDDDDTRRDIENAFALLLDFEDEHEETTAAVPTGDSRVFHESGGIYRIFTTRFDVELDAASQVRTDLLRDYRLELDTLISRQGLNRSRLRRLLLSALALPWRDGRQDGQEEGQIDGRRLAHLISSPMERRLFTRERFIYQANCAVTFLIDCSGSMKDQIRPVAMLVDTLARALEQIGASTEILGYTTGAWNGGRAYREWLRSGRPALPGRLNEVCYRVFKPAERTWRQSRASIAAIFKPDLFREGIDGEAVQWAASRMLASDHPRRILVVISDGCPMDTATTLTNDEFYLDNHLKQVVTQLSATRQIDIVGVGVGLDLSPFYPHNVAVDVSDGLKNQTIYDVAGLLRPSR